MPSLVWMRRDLRATDNPALHAACERSAEVLACVGLPRTQWAEHDLGLPAQYLYQRRLLPLTQQLSSLNIALIELPGDNFQTQIEGLIALCRQHRIKRVFANREYEVNEIDRDQRASLALDVAGIEVHWFEDQCLVPPTTLKTGQGGPYSVFTPYRRRWESLLREQFTPPLPAPPRRPALIAAPAAFANVDDALAQHWPVDDASIQQRLNRFIDRGLDHYQTRRDQPAVDGTSALSPYLAIGAISSRQVLHSVLHRRPEALSDPGDANTFVSELAWRDFYKNLLVEAPRVSRGQAYKT
ncbi:MAG: deoxyribodipyrimidine photo-lyase, partial [Litorivicinus sp.]